MPARSPSPQTRALLAAFLSQAMQWRHGYELAKSIGLSSGTLYPILIRLHERGLLEARWEPSEAAGRPARHAYRLSAEGSAYARQQLESTARPVRPSREVLA